MFRFLSFYLSIFFLLFSVSSLHADMHGDNGHKVGGDFTLTDHNGKKFSLNQLHGKVVLLFFGYTSCPDICPAELMILARVFNKLNSKVDKTRGLFISVDPERDTPEKLKDYVNYFSKNIIGLSGSKDEIDRVTRQYRAAYGLNKNQGVNYTVDHSANLYVIAPTGELHAVVPHGLPAAHVLKIVERLIN